MALSIAGLVALVRDMLLIEAELLLGDAPDVTMDFAADRATRRYREEHMVDLQWQQNIAREEQRLAKARQLFRFYARKAGRQLAYHVRQLPSPHEVLADAQAAKAAARYPKLTLTAKDVIRVYGDPRKVELAKLRVWAERQLQRTKGKRDANADVVRVFVALTLKDVCGWELDHAEFDTERYEQQACATESFALTADGEYDGFPSLSILGGNDEPAVGSTFTAERFQLPNEAPTEFALPERLDWYASK